ncbi:MAG: lipoprotein [Bdellovibrionaceae bacterium]|nr:lipoprotein [Pseudobdellovibrionaceae bacterium]
MKQIISAFLAALLVTGCLFSKKEEAAPEAAPEATEAAPEAAAPAPEAEAAPAE